MSLLSKQEQLFQLLEEQQERICQTFPTHRNSAVVTLTKAKDWHYLKSQDTVYPKTKIITASTPCLFFSGWHKALQFCSGIAVGSPSVAPISPDTPDDSVSALDTWADEVLLECDRLTAGKQVLAYCETGFMSMQQGGQKDFFVWVASKKMPTESREREDIAWWTHALARSYESELQELATEHVSIQQELNAYASQWQSNMSVYNTTPAIDGYYRRLGMLWVKCMACHFLYPYQTVIGGCTVELYRNVLAVLIGLALKHLDLCRAWIAQHLACTLRTLLAPPQATAALIETMSETLEVDREAIRCVVDTYSLSHDNVFYHCSAVGTPAPPLLRLDEQHLVWSLTGLLSEPFLFLIRELKRRYSYEYHTASHLHEKVFRQDLYQLFSNDRFVRSADSVVLKGVQGDLTTDVDALIFDRKAGALALFELKSQDPFAYSRQERIRQRDYFYNASKQVSACTQWLNRNGANALLARLDPKLVKRLKVQKTYIFVLGRYLAHFFDGPEFDRRAAWGTWPQVLRLMNEGSSVAGDANPIQSLYNKLMKDTPLTLSNLSSPVTSIQEITIGESNVYIYPDFKTYKIETDRLKEARNR